MAKPKKKQTLVLTVQITVDASHIIPGSEGYPEQETLRDCLKQELRWCNGLDGQGDYLDMLMQQDGSETRVKEMLLLRPGKEPIVITKTKAANKYRRSA